MKHHKSNSDLRRWKLYFSLSAAAVLAAAPLSRAANVTWDAGGIATNPSWTNAVNWAGDVIPANPLSFAYNANDGTVLFNSAPVDLHSFVDTNWYIGRLSFATTAGNIILSGADITLGTGQSGASATTPNIQFNPASAVITISNRLIFSTNAGPSFPRRQCYMVGNGTLNVYGDMIKPNVDNVSELIFRGSGASGTFNVYGAVYWPDTDVAKTDNSTVAFNNSSNQWPWLGLNVGTVRIGVDNGLPTNSWVDFQQNANATLDLNNFNQTLSALSNSVPNAGSATQRILTGTAAGGSLTLNDNGANVVWNGVVSGNGRLRKMGNGTLAFATKDQTYTGGTLINGGILQLGNGGTGGAIVGDITNNATLIVNKSDALALPASLTGSGSLQHLGSGSLSLAGPNTYSGPTTIATATLTLGGAGPLINTASLSLGSSTATLDASAAGGFSLGTGKSLTGNGTIIGTFSADAGSTINVGNGVGTLTLSGDATLNGPSINMELGASPGTVGGGVNDLIAISGNLTLSGVTTITISPVGPLNNSSPYTLMEYGGTLLAGVATNIQVVSTSPRYTFSVQNPATTAPNIQALLTSAVSGNLLWHGGAAGNPSIWDIASSANWLNGVTPDKFFGGDAVNFDDTALTNIVTLAGALNPSSLTMSNNSAAFVFKGAGSIAASGLLSVEGSGTLVLSNSGPLSFSGVTMDGAGSVNVANSAPNSLGAVTVNNAGSLITLANLAPNSFSALNLVSGTLAFNQPTNVTVSTALTGSGTLIKQGVNVLTLTADNTPFTGNVLVTNGVLTAGNANAIGAGAATVAGAGTLDFNGKDIGSVTVTVQGPGFGGRGVIDNAGPNALTAVRNITFAGDATLGATSNEWDSTTGTILGNGFKVTKVGTGQAWLASGSDTDLGDMDIQAGIFGVESTGTTLGRPANTVTVRSNANLGVWGCATAGEKQIVLQDGGILFGGGGLSLLGGPASTLFLAATGHVDIKNGSTIGYSGTIAGPGMLLKDIDTGMLNLMAPSAHTGGTVVAAGQLRLSHSLALSNNQSVVVFPGTVAGSVINAGVPRIELSSGVVIPSGVTAYFQTDGNLNHRSTFVVNDGACEWQGAIVLTSNGVVNFDALANTTLTVSGPIGDTNFTGVLLARGAGVGVISGQVTINGDFAKTDGATWTISSTGNKWNHTGIAVSSLILGANDALCVTAPLALGQGDANNCVLDMNGFNQTVPDLTIVPGTGSQRIGNESVTSDSLLTFNGGTNISLYGGQIVDALNTGTMNVAVTVASGALYLNGLNSYTGPTTVQNGGTLGGTGTLASAVSVLSGGTLAPGASLGTLTITSNLTLAAGSRTVVELSTSPLASDLVTGLLNVTYGGTLVVTNVAGFYSGGNTFTLFNSASYNGSFAQILPATPGPNLVWNTNNLSVNGQLSVISTVSTNRPTLTNSFAGSTISLSWPLDHIGWRLQSQTNNINVGLRSNWVDVAGSTATNSVSLPVPGGIGPGCLFFRLVYP